MLQFELLWFSGGTAGCGTHTHVVYQNILPL